MDFVLLLALECVLLYCRYVECVLLFLNVCGVRVCSLILKVLPIILARTVATCTRHVLLCAGAERPAYINIQYKGCVCVCVSCVYVCVCACMCACESVCTRTHTHTHTHTHTLKGRSG